MLIIYFLPLIFDSLKTLFATCVLKTIWDSLFLQLLCSISIAAKLLTLLKITENLRTRILANENVQFISQNKPFDGIWAKPDERYRRPKKIIRQRKMETRKPQNSRWSNGKIVRSVKRDAKLFSFWLFAILNFSEKFRMLILKHKSHLTTRAPDCTLLTIFQSGNSSQIFKFSNLFNKCSRFHSISGFWIRFRFHFCFESIFKTWLNRPFFFSESQFSHIAGIFIGNSIQLASTRWWFTTSLMK